MRAYCFRGIYESLLLSSEAPMRAYCMYSEHLCELIVSEASMRAYCYCQQRHLCEPTAAEACMSAYLGVPIELDIWEVCSFGKALIEP
jgi:hypothetical protein